MNAAASSRAACTTLSSPELLAEEPDDAPVAEPAEVPAKLEAKPASGRDSRASSRSGRVIGSKPVVRMRGA